MNIEKQEIGYNVVPLHGMINLAFTRPARGLELTPQAARLLASALESAASVAERREQVRARKSQEITVPSSTG